MDWSALKIEIDKNEVRSKSIMAVMPRGSTGLLRGEAQGIMPVMSNFQKTLSDKRILELLEKK